MITPITPGSSQDQAVACPGPLARGDHVHGVAVLLVEDNHLFRAQGRHKSRPSARIAEDRVGRARHEPVGDARFFERRATKVVAKTTSGPIVFSSNGMFPHECLHIGSHGRLDG